MTVLQNVVENYIQSLDCPIERYMLGVIPTVLGVPLSTSIAADNFIPMPFKNENVKAVFEKFIKHLSDYSIEHSRVYDCILSEYIIAAVRMPYEFTFEYDYNFSEQCSALREGGDFLIKGYGDYQIYNTIGSYMISAGNFKKGLTDAINDGEVVLNKLDSEQRLHMNSVISLVLKDGNLSRYAKSYLIGYLGFVRDYNS